MTSGIAPGGLPRRGPTVRAVSSMKGNRAKNSLFVFLSLLPLSGPLTNQALPGGEQREIRAVWITRWDYRTEADVRRAVLGCAWLGLNRVIFQVRGQADACYRSPIEPWCEELKGDASKEGDPGFDPLQAAIDEARRRGIEVHAWANLLPAWKGTTPPQSRKHLIHVHPGWFMTDEAGRRQLLDAGDYTLLNPCLPEVREYLKTVMADIARRYDLDGIQLDYARFLDRDVGRGEDVPFDPATLRLFKARTGGSPAANPREWDRFRAEAMDRLVAEVSATVRQARPSCQISLAAVRDVVRARTHLFQDAAGWARKRWIDEIHPMNYSPNSERFGRSSRKWVEGCAGVPVVVGIGVHLFDEPSVVLDQLRLLRSPAGSLQPAGYALFAYSDFFPSRSPYARSGAAAKVRRAQLRELLRGANGAVTGAAAGVDPQRETGSLTQEAREGSDKPHSRATLDR